MFSKFSLTGGLLKNIIANIIIVVAVLVVFSLFDSQKVYADACTSPSMWVTARVYMQVYNPDGSLRGYSNNFSFNVSALDPSGYFSVPPGSNYWNQSIVEPGGNAAGASVNVNVTPGSEIYCPQSPHGLQPSYPFTDGLNGKYYLNCLWGVDHNHSTGYRFTGLSVGGFPGWTGAWITPVVEIAPFVYPNGETTDLNKTEHSIILRYQLREPPGPYNLKPSMVTASGTDKAVRGETVRFNFNVHNDDKGLSVLEDGLGSNAALFTGSRGSLTESRRWNRSVIVPGYGDWSEPVKYVDVLIDASASLGSEYCAVLHVNPTHGMSWGPAPPDTPGDPQLRIAEYCVTVVDKPFLHVNNADIWSGILFGDANGQNCSGTADGEIKSWIYNVLGQRGAKGEYALTALGKITDFGSADNLTNPTSNSLKFANTDPDNLGFFMAPNNEKCLPDYYDLFDGIAATIAPGDMDSQPNGVYIVNPGFIFNGNSGGAAYNKQQVFLVNGDIFIDDDFLIAANSATSDDLPYLYFIVRGGNITIADSVTRLDAVLISIPDSSGAGGLIDTCVKGSNPDIGTKITELSTNICNQHLDINGALVAKEVLFKRTFVNNSGDYQPAETINFPPGLFLSNPFEDYLNNSGGALGEVRQIRELPPVY